MRKNSHVPQLASDFVVIHLWLVASASLHVFQLMVVAQAFTGFKPQILWFENIAHQKLPVIWCSTHIIDGVSSRDTEILHVLEYVPHKCHSSIIL